MGIGKFKSFYNIPSLTAGDGTSYPPSIKITVNNCSVVINDEHLMRLLARVRVSSTELL